MENTVRVAQKLSRLPDNHHHAMAMEHINNTEPVPAGPEALQAPETPRTPEAHGPERGGEVLATHPEGRPAGDIAALRRNILSPERGAGNVPPAAPADHAAEEKVHAGGGALSRGLKRFFKGAFSFFGGLFMIGISQAFSGAFSSFGKSSGGKHKGGGGHGGGGSHAKASHGGSSGGHAASGHKAGGGGGHGHH